MTSQVRHECGCVNAVHGPSGVLRSVSKCRTHRGQRRDPGTLGRSYYEELGAIVEGIPQCRQHGQQLAEALGPFPRAGRSAAVALEVGCGASMYAPGLLRAGYEYVGLDPSAWACAWTTNAFDAETVRGTIESAKLAAGQFDLVLAAHCLEHAADAPGAVARCAGLLRRGGELWVVVPDDSDPCNPDHIYFFTCETLRGCLESAGLVIDRMTIRKYVKHENFIYARARKPA